MILHHFLCRGAAAAALLLLAACAVETGTPVFPEPPAGSQPAVAAVPPPPVEPTTPDGVRTEIARWFLKHGYRNYQVGALITHADIESGFHPCAVGPGGYHYTFQWSGRRLRQLYEFAGARSCPPLDKQLAFADRELRSEPQFACFWNATTAESALTALRRGFGHGSC